MVVIVMGVSGSGKSTIAEQLSDALGLPFYDADDFHPQANIDKMKHGEALNDADRMPWLSILSEKIAVWNGENGGVLACSALKESYRQVLSAKVETLKWIYLDGSFEVILHRMQTRQGHFMKPAMLQSQFDALEIPDYALRVAISQSVKECVERCVEVLMPNRQNEFVGQTSTRQIK